MASVRDRITKDLLVSLTIVAIGMFAAISSLLIRIPSSGDTSGRTVPFYTSLALIILGVIEAISSLKNSSESSQQLLADNEAKEDQFVLNTSSVLCLLVLCAGYAFMIDKVGYHISTAFAGVGAMWLFGMRKPLGLLAVAILCPLIYHIVFFQGLSIYPPYGEWIDPIDRLLGN